MVPADLCAGGDDKPSIVQSIAASALLQPREPDETFTDGEADDGDIIQAVYRARQHFIAIWQTDAGEELLTARLDERVTPVSLRAPGRPIPLHDVVAFVASAPVAFVVGCDTSDTSKYGFADTYGSHGWGVFFKGEGHRRLVSRRWLEHGPWLVHYGANDTTYVQFSDLEADLETQLAQRAIGHEQMGISNVGGFISRRHPIVLPPNSYYLPEQRRFEVTVYGRAVPEREMADAAAIRVLQALGPERPVDVVTYVFAVESEARAHLHRLWMREIEVVTFIDGHKTLLSDGYAPPRDPPDWVKDVEARLAGIA
jgi:hypothetical protein